MKRSRYLSRMAKCGAARTLALVAAMLLTLEPFAFALVSVYKYPTGNVITPVNMGSSMTLEKGTVFGFNSAKSANDTDAFATVQESACATPATNWDYTEGREGFATTAATNISYGTSGVEGHNAGGALQTRLAASNTTARTYTWSKSFLWDCGIPSGAVPVSVWYRRGATWVNQGATANLSVVLVKPDLTTVTLIPSTSVLGTANSAWTQLSANVADPTTTFNQPGLYTVRLTGTLQGAGSGTNMYLFLDDFSVGLTSGYDSYAQDVEFTVRATPYSSLASNQYLLDIRARKISGDTETTDIQVCGDNLPTCAIWTTPPGYSITSTTWTVFNNYYLTAAEYNNGNVRVRYVDTISSNDTNRGGIDVEYQRVGVDQGTCVDQVQNMEADCGKCHNYGGDIAKPWPDMGMHDKHAQTESISDCLWCHPDNGTNSAHRNGVQGGYAIELAGTKVYRALGANPQGAVGSYDSTTKRCSNVDCHMGNLTPRWDSTYGLTQAALNDANGIIARNCSRCHNSGTAGPDTYSGPSGNYAPNIADLNINVAWPSTGDGGGHTSHNAAVSFDASSCQTNGSCHPDNTGQHSVVADAAGVVVKMSPSYASPNAVVKYFKASATMGDGKCVNVSCHGGQVTPTFNTASTNPINLTLTNGTACIMCHVGEQATGWGTAPGNAAQYNSPISGLHRGSPPVSGQDHAGTLTNGCQACHALTGLTKHFQSGGVTNLDTPAMDPVDASYFIAAIGYTAGSGTSPNYTTPPSCGVTTTTCHAEGNTTYRNPRTTWQRKWSWDAYDTVTPVNQCKNCHGWWGSFSTGVVEPHVLSNTDNTLRTTLMNNHSDSGVNCATMCHGQGGTNYNHGVAVGATSKDMSLNTNVGVTKTAGPPARVGCNFCHSANDGTAPDGAGGNHVFTESTWVTDTLVTGGVAPTCYNPGASASCHGDGVGQYWPDDTPSVYPNRLGKHTFHITKLATKLGIGTSTDADQKRLCQYCHPASPGAAGHADQIAPADITGVNPYWDVANPPATADTGTLAAFSNTDGSCSGIDCHNNQATGVTYNWRTGATSTCLMCHTPGGAGSNPISGLHSTTPTISGASGLHDDSFGVGGTCVSCHTTLTAQTTHINGTFLGNGTLAPDRTAMGLFATYTAVDATVNGTGTCSGAGVAGTDCHGSAAYGAGDAGTWVRKWNSSYANATGATNECKQCHGGLAGNADWNFGSATVNTGDTTVDHQGNYDAVGGSQMYGNHGGSTTATACNLCHVYADAPYTSGAFATYHRNGTITLNSTLGMTLVANSCTTNCHTNGGSHTVDASGWSKALVAGPALTCATCHASITTHTDADGAGATYTAGTCTDCHTDHAVANRTGTNAANNIYIKTTYGASVAVPTMNKQYASATHNGWIQLGGAATLATATTEAQMCWGCHDLRSVSEWGTNADTSTFNSTYDYGNLYTTKDTIPGTTTSNWVGAYWRSGKGRHSNSGTNPFWYKRGAIQSTHSVNFDSGTAALTTSGNSLGFGRTETADSVANIRCSYCHDVHGTHNGVNGDLNGGAGSGTTDAPYLRGNWKANPYKEDGAPQLKMANWTVQGSATKYGSVPRGSASPTNTGTTAVASAGGWWIDQNSNNPNSTTNVHKTSGLCEQCHGTNKTGTWATASIGTIDWATTGADAATANWTSGYNGHANSVLNGPGRGANASAESYARNIFTRTKRGTSTQSETGSAHSTVGMGLASYASTSRGYSYRGADGYNWTPTGISQTTAWTAFAWGTPGTQTPSRNSIWATGSAALTMSTAAAEPASYDAQANYHTFTCSKCHNPHASRLPKLMITNCLDTNHNTWEDDTTFTGTNPAAPFANTRHSQWASAQNCHRLDANASKTSGQANTLGKGWNRVTPWLEFTSPNSTRTTITPP